MNEILEDAFEEVPSSEIPTILNILEKNWTNNFLLHQFISIMAHDLGEKSQITQVLFCSGSFENGVYIIETKFQLVKNLSFFFVYSLAHDLISLKRALMATNIIPWHKSESYLFEVTLSRFTQVICQVLIAKSLKFAVENYKLMWLPPEVEVFTKEIPKNLCLCHLSESHGSEIDRQWPSFRNQKEVLESEISSLFGLGIFDKNNGKMLSYALCFHSGGIFMLSSDLSARRRGLGDLITRNMIFKIRQRGWVPFCTISPDNNPSMNLFKKIGFIEYDKADFVFSYQFLSNMVQQ